MRFQVPFDMDLPKDLRPFLVTGREPEIHYEAELLTQPLCLPAEAVAQAGQVQVFRRNNGWLRVYPALTAPDGCQTACLFGENGRHTLYLPASDVARYQRECSISNLIAGELLLMSCDCFLLHSSVVAMHGRTVLFSGPSGIGKSTQADIWKRSLGAEVVNGDRCAISKRASGFYGCGSPYCGSSGIYSRVEAPIQGIFVLRQAKENRLRRMEGGEAFRALFAQCILNTWDAVYMMHLMDLLTQLLASTPVYALSCRPDEEAAALAYHALFKEI